MKKLQMPQASLKEQFELKRLKRLTLLERKFRKNGYDSIAGVDEAGRGPLAGPVVAAACVIPPKLFFPGVDDSKKLLPKKREILFDQITSHPDVYFGIGIVSHTVIDQINIYQASIQAMITAVDNLKILPSILFVDGLTLPHTIPCHKIIRGDSLSQSIAAASIIAKVTRDRIMCEYDLQWPGYGFKEHKGYGTAQHQKALETLGPCPIHRISFSLLPL